MMRLPKSKYYRMPEWKNLRNEFLSINSQCEICGAKATEVHHDFDYNYYYWTDEDFFNENNWMPLCKECHSRITSQNKILRQKEKLN